MRAHILNYDPEIGSKVIASNPFVFATDEANRCIKWLHTGTGHLTDAYRSKSETRVHNVLIHDPSDDNNMLAIESVLVSRLVGVLIRNEVLYRLVQLTRQFREEKTIWENTWSADFYRVETDTIETELPSTSLCLAGSFVLCAVSQSHLLVAFEYVSPVELMKMAGDQRFDERIQCIDALNSATGSLQAIAIAFADDSIRLYRMELNRTAFTLQETYRVFCENVCKLLFAGERLLVAERSEDEEMLASGAVV